MRMFENANFKFVENRNTAYLISGVLVLLSLLVLTFRGVELGIDFQGGEEFVVETTEALSSNAVRDRLTPVFGSEPEVKTYGDDALLIRTGATEDLAKNEQRIIEAIGEAFPGSAPRVVKTDVVGPRFAQDLKQGAVYSVLGSLLVVFVYILIRFEWRYGLGAVAALFHDVTITLGVFSAFNGILPFSLQIDQTIIAAFLTIVGYSLNDTVVVFDRIRESVGILKTERFERIVNRSINATLSRTLITSGTTLLAAIVLFIFGGDVLRGFAFALLIGVGVGSYSSIFVASPMVIELRERKAVRR